MKGLIQFIKEFLQNKGLFVFGSIVISKLAVFVIAIIAARLMPEDEYGKILIIASVFGIFVAITGMGSAQGLARYGNLETDALKKDELSRYVFWSGFIRHLLVTCFFFLISLFYISKHEDIFFIIPFFVIRLLGFYFFSHIQADYRIRGDNKMYSYTNIVVNTVAVILVLGLTYFFGVPGYLVAMAVSPWFSLIYLRKWKVGNAIPKLNRKEFWKYAFHASVTYFLSDLFISLDMVLIGFMLDDISAAFYKVAIIIPMNLSFLPLIFIQTDFPKLAQKYRDKDYLTYYVINYYKIFIPAGLILLCVGFWVKDWIVPAVFGENYANENDGWVFYIILCALVGNMWMRNLYGNLASAIGKASWNTYITVSAFVLMLVLGLVLIPIYGILGAAVGLAITFTFTGIAGMWLFHNYLRNLKSEES